MARLDEVLAGEATWGRYALDVAGHAGLGAAYALPFVAIGEFALEWEVGPQLAMGEAAALLGGAARELAQALSTGKLHLLDRLLDVAHHALGPPVAIALVAIAQLLL